MRMCLGKRERCGIHAVDVRPAVIFEDVAVHGFEAVVGTGFVVDARHPLVPVLAIVLEEPVPCRVQDAIRTRVPAVEAIHVVGARIERQDVPLNDRVEGAARQLDTLASRTEPSTVETYLKFPDRRSLLAGIV